jgi:ESCRT-I complex subunit VPS37
MSSSVYGSPSQPDYSAALASIQNLDKERLQELLNDEQQFDALVKDLSQVKALYREKEMLMASNRSLAEYNLSQEPVLAEARSKLAEKHREAMKTAERAKNVKRDLDDKAGNVEPDTLLALLQAAHAEAEESSDAIADEFLSKRMNSVEDFLEQFLVGNRAHKSMFAQPVNNFPHF